MRVWIVQRADDGAAPLAYYAPPPAAIAAECSERGWAIIDVDEADAACGPGESNAIEAGRLVKRIDAAAADDKAAYDAARTDADRRAVANAIVARSAQ